MEEDQERQPEVNNVPQVTDKKRLNIWMIVSIVLLIVLIGAGAYLLGKNQLPTSKTSTLQQGTTKNSTPTPVQQSATISATPTSANNKKVSAGITNQFFSPYTITVPAGWKDNHTTNTASDLLTLTKAQYVLTVSQSAGGAGRCIFPGDTPEPMAQEFNSFVGITGITSQFRRGTADNTTYTVCEQKNGVFSFPTTYGYITYTVPAQADQTIIGEMDAMVASLTK